MRIGVVGFGVAGSTASALLAAAGHDVTVFERAPSAQPVGAGVLLQPSGQRVLERLGVLESVRATAARIDELVALSTRGRAISRMRLSQGLHALGVHRADLMAVLQDLATAAGASIRHGEGVDGLSDRRLSGFDLVVGADGSRSALRAGSGLVRWEHEYAWGALWAIGRGDRVQGRLHQVVRGTSKLVGVLPLGGGRCNVFWSVRRDPSTRSGRAASTPGATRSLHSAQRPGRRSHPWTAGATFASRATGTRSCGVGRGAASS